MVIGIKISKYNFEELLDKWVDKIDIKVAYVYHVQYLTFTQLADYAYVHNIVIKDTEIWIQDLHRRFTPEEIKKELDSREHVEKETKKSNGEK